MSGNREWKHEVLIKQYLRLSATMYVQEIYVEI